jgi:hypothetical protein
VRNGPARTNKIILATAFADEIIGAKSAFEERVASVAFQAHAASPVGIERRRKSGIDCEPAPGVVSLNPGYARQDRCGEP